MQAVRVTFLSCTQGSSVGLRTQIKSLCEEHERNAKTVIEVRVIAGREVQRS